MTIKVTHNSTVIYPELLLTQEWQHRTNNIVHDIIGSPVPAFTLRPAGSRSGTLLFFCLDAEQALALGNLHLDVGLFAVTDSDVPSADMTYIPDGVIKVALDPAGRLRWTVSVDFREVA
jgi:hypothetical protein